MALEKGVLVFMRSWVEKAACQKSRSLLSTKDIPPRSGYATLRQKFMQILADHARSKNSIDNENIS